MSWLKKFKKKEDPSPSINHVNLDLESEPSSNICCEVFKSYWLQICKVISATSPRPALIQTQATRVQEISSITSDDVNTVKNLMEQMIYLLAEEQSTEQLLGPVLEYAITQDIFAKLHDWWSTMTTSSFQHDLLLNLLKVYEVLISQAQHSLLHQKQILAPIIKLLSTDNVTRSEELDGHTVMVLNLLCVWMNRDPTLLEVFLHSNVQHGPANFVVFSLLIQYIHREGTVGQQARDALLLCMSLSSEQPRIADYIVTRSNFAPVLATGLSALYSTLPRHIEVRADDWHCLQRNDWAQVHELSIFMNSFEFCNSVIEVAHPSISEQLLDFIHHGFLVSVFGPSLHKTSASEVIVTTAYLNLFLRAVTAPPLMRCFLRFLLTHRHDNALIINTLVQRANSTNRLALVSLSLIRTLVDLNCEDFMLQLLLRYLVPCQHILASQRRAIRDVDLYNASASRFLALTPSSCSLDRDISSPDQFLRPVTEAHDDDETSSHDSRANPVSESSPDHGNGNHDNEQDDSVGSNIKRHLHDSSLFVTFRHKYHDLVANRYVTPSSGNHRLPLATDSSDGFTINEDLSVTVKMRSSSDAPQLDENRAVVGVRTRSPTTITSPHTMAEFGPDLKSQLALNTSYMDYLEDAKRSIEQCRSACSRWTAPYDGLDPPPDLPAKEDAAEPDQTSNSRTSTLLEPDLPTTDDRAMESALSATARTLTLTHALLSPPPDDVVFAPDATSSNDVMTCENAATEMSNPESPGVTSALNDVCSGIVTSSRDVMSSAPSSWDGQVVTSSPTFVAPKVETMAPSSNDDFTNPVGRSWLSGRLPEVTTSKIQVTERKVVETDTDKKRSAKSSAVSQSVTSSMHPTAVNNQSTSTVDEFFRGLMEIVPKVTRDRADAGSKVKSTVLLEEDFESGIEVSSEGDTQNHVVSASGDAPEDEVDSLSQMSLNSDEMRDDVIGDASGVFDDTNSLLPHSHSFADDTDDELDDTSSITSSFYEYHDAYTPTEMSITPAIPIKLQSMPYTGPLIVTLLGKLEQMMINSLYENLLLTGILTRLACYPQPLLRSFLLNTQMVFHPSVRSLYQVLTSVRNKLEAYASTVADFKILVGRAQKYLLARGTTSPPSSTENTRNVVTDRPMPVPKVKTRVLGDILRRKGRRKKQPLLSKLDTLLESRNRSESTLVADEEREARESGMSVFYVRQRRQERRDERKERELHTKNAVYATIVLAEFVKELAAVAQEHAVADRFLP